ncbi:outer membrane protein assembly factor BamB family protein [Saccharibacillus alkalitolerans]|uniref:PQQ-binding-like beta-propeller repeat protein n=1 Tax=Saccharibacillus alkalitolerans TaxID=2705290 RepID=A0ABX0F2L7_9BACL|nr:PQQ-binding-like beta-propeller repeat protein [Saccharibacillus alkalitolerans]NGZ74608.1 PQQ-binding-like beta-propeller repeat protein [Saccharibacillus alkalitolerans]
MKTIRITAAAAALLLTAGIAVDAHAALAKNDNKSEVQTQFKPNKQKENEQPKNGNKPFKKAAARAAASLKASWEIPDISFPDHPSALPAAAGLVFYEADGWLRAADASTGLLKWTYKASAVPAAESANAVFLIGEDGRLVRIDAQKGKAAWTVKKAAASPENASAKLVQGTLYVSDPSMGIKAFNAANGKRKWTSPEAELQSLKTIERYDGVLVATGVTEQDTQTVLGIDAENGDLLWQLDGAYDVLTQKDGKLLLRDKSGFEPVLGEADEPKENADIENSDDGAEKDTDEIEVEPQDDSAEEASAYLVELVYADLESGRLSSAGRYVPLDGEAPDLANSSTFLSGGYAYTADETENGFALTAFRMNEGSSKHSLKSYADEGGWLGGPSGGLLFFQKGTVLNAVKMAGGTSLSFGDLGAKASYGPIAAGRNVYVGLENGEVLVFDAKTSAALGKWSVGSKNASFVSGPKNSVIIRTEDKLIGLSAR